MANVNEGRAYIQQGDNRNNFFVSTDGPITGGAHKRGAYKRHFMAPCHEKPEKQSSWDFHNGQEKEVEVHIARQVSNIQAYSKIY